MEQIRILGNKTEDEIRALCLKDYTLQPTEYVISSYEEYSTVTFSVPDRIEPSKFMIAVSPGAYQAYLSLYPSINTGSMMSIEQVFQLISDEGVTLNLEEKAITEAYESFMNGDVVENLLISQGVEATKGRDAEITIHFDKKDNRPKIVDGKVDYKEVNVIQVVHKGDILITKKLATQGSRGKNVKGDDIPPIPGADIVILLGDGATVNDTGTVYTATVDGYVEYGNNRLAVHPVYIVNGDVDYSTGNIKFNGAVHVKGEVLSGFRVEANKSILVDGVCQDCELVSKGNIILRTGIKSTGAGTITADGAVNVGYAENAKIYAKENIEIRKYAYNCELFAGGRIDATAGDGIVAGGVLNAFREISVKQLGTTGNMRFPIYVGYKYFIEAELERLRVEIGRATDIKEKLDETLSGFDLTNDKIITNPKITKLLNTDKAVTELIAVLKEKEEKLITDMRAKNPRIKVKNRIYEGVRVNFYNVGVTLKEELENIVFYYDEKYKEVAWVSMKNINSIELND